MGIFGQDFKFALRQLRRSPGFALTAVLTVALSTGAMAALTGVLNATLWATLPYTQANRVVRIKDVNLRGFKSNGIVSFARSADLQTLQHDGHPEFQSLAFFYLNRSTLAVRGHEPVPSLDAAVSGTFFDTLQTAPLLGRTLVPSDDVPNSPIVAVISYRLWQTSFAGNPGVLGEVVRIGDAQATIVGVMGPKFALPISADLWLPGHIFASNFRGYRGSGSRFLNVIARLDDHETLASGTAAVQQLATQLAGKYPDSDGSWGFSVSTLRDSLFGSYRRALLLIGAATVMILLVVAINVAGLQLARNAARQTEFAIRGALGITSARLLRQLLTENLVLMLGSSLLGLAVAAAGLRLLAARLPADLLAVDTPHLDYRALLLTAAVAMLIALVTGLMPWLQSNRRFRTAPAMSSNRTTAVETRRFGRWFGVLQIMLALVLLTLAASVLRSLYGLLRQPLGFDTAQTQSFTVDLPWSSTEVQRHQQYAALEQQLLALPGTQGAGAMTALPLSEFSVRATYDLVGQAPTPNHDAVVAEARSVTPGLLSAMRIPLLAGRLLTARDADQTAPGAVLVNQTLAHRYFGDNTKAVGHRLVTKLGAGGTVLGTSEIVGVAGDVAGTGGTLGSGPQPEVYTPENGGWPHMQFAVRTTRSAKDLEPVVRRLVAEANPFASVSHFSTLADAVDHAESQPRLNAELLTLFAAFATLLVMVGVYGLAAFSLAQRGREFALRIALGSSRRSIWSLVIWDNSRILVLGLALGFACSLALTRVLPASGLDSQPFTFTPLILASAVLATSVLMAVLIPARRASTIDPMHALRSE